MKGLITMCLFFGILVLLEGATNFNVLNYGAVGDGRTDDSKAFLKAWKNVCEASGTGIPTLVAPLNYTFLLNPIGFQGPCKSSNVQFQIAGKIIAPNDMGAWGQQKGTWLAFNSVNGLTIDGGGTIDGQGSIWWNYCKRNQSCSRPTALFIHQCNGLRLTDLKHLNSQRNHITINGCKGALLSSLQIEAPSTSPNTDGVDISASTDITIFNSSIGTGDDCIAIIGQTSCINITSVQCGPGHGISVGSLGRNGASDTVERVHVRNCTFIQSSNGVRIKTWQGWTGYANNIWFEDIQMVNSLNPIIIDQHYSNYQFESPQPNSSEKGINNITYRNINGSSAVQRAINFECISCNNIVMENITLTASQSVIQVSAYCTNTSGIQNNVSPSVPCLSKGTPPH